jgi:hypothetical protein
MLIDCEVGHYGDPAFDLGFFLTHLVAKSIYFTTRTGHTGATLGLCEAFLAAYAQSLKQAVSADDYAALERRAVLNLAGCLLARVDGKSPLEYLTSDAERNALRRSARRLFDERPASLATAVKRAADIVD